MNKYSDKQIVDSWRMNVNPWVSAIRNGEIENRLLITNRAIVDVVLNRKPKTVLDVGCGEGWLVRELAKEGVGALGIDVVPELIKFANREHAGRYQQLAYEDLSEASLSEKFDVIVANFSLLGNESVKSVFRQAPFLLNEGGAVIVQTIHPVVGGGNDEYKDGWREGSWEGFNSAFCNPAPWYFRTIESWIQMFKYHGFSLSETIEPLNPKSNAPASIVFIGVLPG